MNRSNVALPSNLTRISAALRGSVPRSVGPLVEDIHAKRDDRIFAIRKLGSRGYAQGPNSLIAILETESSIPSEEIIRALESISGQVVGGDPNRWKAWWSNVPAEIREWRPLTVATL
jgi:hypothetical protein